MLTVSKHTRENWNIDCVLLLHCTRNDSILSTICHTSLVIVFGSSKVWKCVFSIKNFNFTVGNIKGNFQAHFVHHFQFMLQTIASLCVSQALQFIVNGYFTLFSSDKKIDCNFKIYIFLGFILCRHTKVARP